MPQIMGERPPDPDHVAPRGTDAYRDAVTELHRWVAKNHSRGVPLDQLVDRYDDFGNTSHDWKEWNDWGGGFHKPAEWGEEQWNIGNFRRQAAAGDYTEWPPGSGIFFNDPANDSSARQWFNDYGDQIGQPGGLEDMPEIDYGAVNSGFGGNVGKYLASEVEHKKNAKKAPGIDPNEASYKEGVPTASVAKLGATTAQQPNLTHGAWGVSSANTFAAPKPMMPQQQAQRKPTPSLPFSGPSNPFAKRTAQQRPGMAFSQTAGYQPWRR